MKRSAPAAPLGGDASPQTGKGHGHTEVSNELLEAIMRYPFSAAQLRFVLAVVRDSYGWKRKVTAWRSVREWSVFAGLPVATADRAMRELKGLGVVEVDVKTGGLALIKNYLAWGMTPELELFTGDSFPIDVPSELSTAGDNPVDNSASPIAVPLAGLSHGRDTAAVPLAGRKPSTGGTPIKIGSTDKERKKGAAGAAPAHPILPNGQNDTARNRAELGHPDLAPEGAPDHARMTYKIQDEFNDTWKASREEWKKKNLCRRCRTAPKASEKWSFCRPCTRCSTCSSQADGGRQFTARGDLITCSICAPLPEAVPK